jgi:toxin YhaV
LTTPNWLLLAHPAFLSQLDASRLKINAARDKAGSALLSNFAVKRHFALVRQITERIPQNPSSTEFRLGNTLGPKYKLWFRAKFLQQYRIFFRYSSMRNILVYGWVNDENTLRSYGSKTDAYMVFKKVLESGKVPNSWDELIAESKRLS